MFRVSRVRLKHMVDSVQSVVNEELPLFRVEGLLLLGEVADEHHGELGLEGLLEGPEVLPMASPPPGRYPRKAQPGVKG